MMRVFRRLSFLMKAARLGPDMPLTHVLLYSRGMANWLCRKKFLHFGANAEFRPGAYAIETGKIHIGSQVILRPGVMLFASGLSDIKCQISIGDKCLVGSGVHVYVSNHQFTDPNIPIFDQGHSDVRPVEIQSGAWIGANVIILPGVVIGRNAVVGAGSVVTRSVEPCTVVGGNPARLIKRIG